MINSNIATEQNISFLDNIELVLSYITGLPQEVFLRKYNCMFRTGRGYYATENGKKVFKEHYHNYYYHAPEGREDIQEFYHAKDKAAKDKAASDAKKEGRTYKDTSDNHIYGEEQLKRWLRNKQHQGLFVYFLPHSIDSGSSIPEVDRFGGKCRVIRIENDDTCPIEEKIEYFKRLGLPAPSLIIFSGGKSPHFLFVFFSDNDDDGLPGIEWERVAESNAQLLRNSGHDGYHKDIQTLINEAKTLLIRLPGFEHQKTRKESKILEVGNIWDINELEAQVNQLPKLGNYKLQKGTEFAPDTYPGDVQAFETILSPEWKQRFHPYESYADTQAKLAAKAEAEKVRLEAAKAAREKQLQGLSAQEIQRRAESINGEEISLLTLVYPSVRQQIEKGTPDGTGRSHTAAASIAKSLLEAEYLVNGSPLRAIDSAEQLFQQWIDRTFNSSENDKIAKVKKAFNHFKGQTNVPKARQVNYFESLLAKKQDIKVGEDAITHLIHNRTITNLIEEAVRGLKQKPQPTTFSDLPLLYNTSKNGWNNSIEFLNQNKSIYVTTEATHALAILNSGIPGVVYVNPETSALNLHLLAEYACENGFSINFTPNAPSTDRMLAENLRAGFFSQITRNLLRKNNKTTKIKDYKPEVIVVDENSVEWSAHYYWVRVPQVITPKMLGNKNKRDSVLYGYTAKHKWFSDVVAECESVAKNRKLVAFVSEMGTGKTEVLSKNVKSWGSGVMLAIAHREQLTRQAARRLSLVDYKSDKFKNANEKYAAAKEQGLAITINTLCQGTNEQGYLPEFKIDDWKNSTLVIDETESFVKYLMESGTIAENRQKAITALRELIHAIYEGGGRIILADANLRLSTINLFQRWCAAEKYEAEKSKANYSCYIILNSYCKFKEEGRKAIFSDNRDGLVSEVYRRLEPGASKHKSLLFTDVKQSSGKFFFATQSFGNFMRDLKIGRILDADTRLFNDDPDHKLVDELHAAVIACNKGIIFISPVIDSGTDWNNLGLDCVYGVYMGIMGIDNTLQQLERVRDNVVRHLWAARRSCMGMTKGDIQNLEKNFEEVRRSYDNSKAALMTTWAEMKVLQHSEIEARIAGQFPNLDPHLLAWWQDSLEESFYAAQEFRINLKARMMEKGYTIEQQDFEVDSEFIATLQEYGEAQKEKKYNEIATAELALLDKIEKNEDTMPKATARAKDLKSCLYALGIKIDAEDPYSWCNGYTDDERLELVKRTLGKKSKMRRTLVYGFSFRCAMSNDQKDIAKIIYMAEEFRNMINSSSRSIKDTPMSMKAGIDFMTDKMDIHTLAKALMDEATKRGKRTGNEAVMFFHNRMPIILKTNKVLVENRAYVKKTFGFDVDVRPEMAARNISTFFTNIGWNVERGKNREAGEGKAANGNAPLNNYLITEDPLTFKIWKGWVAQYEKKDEGMFSYFYNPSGDEGGDARWKAKHGVLTEETDKQVSKPVFQILQQHRQLELVLNC